MRGLAWVWMLMVALTAVGCGSSSSDPVPTTGTVSGRVVDSDGAGIAGATVIINSDPVEATTDANGDFSATVPIGDHTLTVYLNEQTFQVLETQLSIAGDQNTDLGQLSPEMGSEYYGDGIVWYADADGDEYPDLAVTPVATDGKATAPGPDMVDGATLAAFTGDCDDNDEVLNPATVWYVDADGDDYSTGDTQTQCEQPAGYALEGDLDGIAGDCDDDDAALNPETVWYLDADGDDYSTGDTDTQCVQPADHYLASDLTEITGDCDDDNAALNPETVWYLDADGDGYSTGDTEIQCLQPADHSLVGELTATSGDCDDVDGTVNPGATEVCNEVDDNCNDSIDEGVTTTYYQDLDSDLYGNSEVSQDVCTQPAGYVTDGTDCDDADGAVNPGAAEVCNSIDDNCDGSLDEGLETVTYYQDGDGDSYGNDAVSQVYCMQPTGYVLDNTDCDDTDIAVNPGAAEVCNGIDDNCVGGVDDGVTTVYYADSDGDSYGDNGVSQAACTLPVGYVEDNTDCDDTAIAVNPGATEVCNGVDDNCSGGTDEGVTTTYYADGDGDSFGNADLSQAACTPPEGYVEDNTDCDDTATAVNPGATEICNGIDDDCNDGADEGFDPVTYYQDADIDTYGNPDMFQVTCDGAPAGYVAIADDCDDTDAAVNPGASETCNGIDDNCDGSTDEGLGELTTFYQDLDTDTYGNAMAPLDACEQPMGYVTDATDCDDGDIAVNPGAEEVCNGVDDDCSSLVDDGLATSTHYQDADDDGFGNNLASEEVCAGLSGYVMDNTDCDDTSETVYPGAAEVLNDGIDQDCNGADQTGTADFRFTYKYLQYRTHENPADDGYRAWFSVTKDGQGIVESDVQDVFLSDSSGTPLEPTTSGFLPQSFMFYNCSGASCAQSGPIAQHGFWGTFDSLPADTYGIELLTNDGQTVTTSIDYSGQWPLPVVSSGSMQSSWSGGDLVLTWENPTTGTNWNTVDQIRVFILDGAGNLVLLARVSPSAETVTLPAALLSQGAALGAGTLVSWQVQTRAHDGNGMNFARGNSDTKVITEANPTAVFAVEPTPYLQYRTFENPASDSFRGWIALTKDGGPVADTDINDVWVWDSDGTSVEAASLGFAAFDYMYYDCSASPCEEHGPLFLTGIWARFDSLDMDTYDVEVETSDGQLVSTEVVYPGIHELPVVASTSLQNEWSDGDLTLAWTNPTGDPNWDLVDQIRVVVLDGAGATVLWVRVDPSESMVALPAALLSQAQGLGNGSLVEWRVELRSYDTGDMNFARSQSNRADITSANATCGLDIPVPQEISDLIDRFETIFASGLPSDAQYATVFDTSSNWLDNGMNWEDSLVDWEIHSSFFVGVSFSDYTMDCYDASAGTAEFNFSITTTDGSGFQADGMFAEDTASGWRIVGNGYPIPLWIGAETQLGRDYDTSGNLAHTYTQNGLIFEYDAPGVVDNIVVSGPGIVGGSVDIPERNLNQGDAWRWFSYEANDYAGALDYSQYSIAFENNGGSVFAPVTVLVPTAPPAPSEEAYIPSMDAPTPAQWAAYTSGDFSVTVSAAAGTPSIAEVCVELEFWAMDDRIEQCKPSAGTFVFPAGDMLGRPDEIDIKVIGADRLRRGLRLHIGAF